MQSVKYVIHTYFYQSYNNPLSTGVFAVKACKLKGKLSTSNRHLKAITIFIHYHTTHTKSNKEIELVKQDATASLPDGMFKLVSASFSTGFLSRKKKKSIVSFNTNLSRHV